MQLVVDASVAIAASHSPIGFAASSILR